MLKMWNDPRWTNAMFSMWYLCLSQRQMLWAGRNSGMCWGESVMVVKLQCIKMIWLEKVMEGKRKYKVKAKGKWKKRKVGRKGYGKKWKKEEEEESWKKWCRLDQVGNCAYMTNVRVVSYAHCDWSVTVFYQAMQTRLWRHSIFPRKKK